MSTGFYQTIIIIFLALNVAVKSFLYSGNLLHTAAKEGCVGTAEMMIHLGMPINKKDPAGDQPVHIAAKNGQMDFLRLLSRYQANMSELNDMGLTPIYLFAKSGLPGSGRILVDTTLNPALEWSKKTALYWAVEAGNTALVKTLSEGDANGDTPFDIPVSKNDYELPFLLGFNNAIYPHN